MKKFMILAAAIFCASTAKAVELGGISASDVSAYKIEVPAPILPKNETAPKCGHVSGEITKLHLLARTGKSLLYTSAKTEADFREFVVIWTQILNKFAITVTSTEYKSGFGTLTYASPDGRVLRDFLAEKLHYDARSSTEIAKLQHELLEPLEQAGMTPVASFTIKNDVFNPTFNIYYLTKPEETQERETQLRQLMNGDDIDFDLLASAIKLVKRDTSFSMVYIGRELGFKTKVSATEEGVTKKLEDFKKFLVERKKELVVSKIFKIEQPFTVGTTTYNYAANIYFYQ